MQFTLSGWWLKILMGGLLLIILLITFAYMRVWNRTELEFRIQINQELIQVSTYGEPPTFAIWLENGKGDLDNVYITHRAYENDWEGKPEVPVALPYWFFLNKSGIIGKGSSLNGFLDTDAVSGATPRDDLFVVRVEVPRDSVFLCWIEMNLSGDYNDYYKETDPVKMTSDEYGNGQPALIYFGEIKNLIGQRIEPEIYGMSILTDTLRNIIQPVYGITTADEVFSSIQIEAVRPKPYIIR